MNDNFNNNLNTGANSNPEANGARQEQQYNPNNGYYANNSSYGNGWPNTQQTSAYATQNNGFQQPPEPKEKRKTGAIVVVGIVCLALIIASVFLGYKILTYDPSTAENLTSVTNIEEGQSASNQAGSLEFAETPSNTDSANGTISANDVYKKVNESSVGILVYTNNSNDVHSEGTGVVMGFNGDNTSTYIITCAHVVDAKEPKIVVQAADGKQYDATVVGLDLKTDIGVLLVEGTELKPAEFADSSTLEVGDTVYAIGNPGGSHFFGSFTDGMVSAIGRPIDSPVGYEVACIQHTAPINPGNSGGALVNEYGQVVGINSSKIAAEAFEGMGFSVPSSMVKQVVDELIKNGYVSNRPALGIEFSQATQSQSHSLVIWSNDLPTGAVIIEGIMSHSDMNNTKAKVGDMIIAVNGVDLDSYDTLLDAVEKGKVGDTLTLTIARVDSEYNVTTFDVNVKLVEDKSASNR